MCVYVRFVLRLLGNCGFLQWPEVCRRAALAESNLVAMDKLVAGGLPEGPQLTDLRRKFLAVRSLTFSVTHKTKVRGHFCMF